VSQVNRITIAVSLLLLVPRFAGSAQPQAVVPHLGEDFIPLLQGRLLVRMPKGAKVEPRQYVTPEMPQDETRVVYEEGETKIVLRAQETFRLGHANYHQELEKTVSGWGKESGVTFSTSPLLKADGFEVTQVTPSRVESTEDLVLLRTGFAHLPDNTIVIVSVSANPFAVRDAPTAANLAESILKSIAPGKTVLDRSAGVRKLYIYSDKNVLAMSLPDGFTVTSDEGPDFLVHRCWKIKPFDQPSGSLGIYVGNMPHLFHLIRDKSSMILAKVPGRLLGQKVEWFDARPRGGVSGNQSRLTEAILAKKGFHVFFTSRNDEEFKEFKSIAQSLKIEPK